MICNNCGNEVIEGNTFCGKCGARMEPDSNVQMQYKPYRHEVPMCTKCGYVGEWVLDPILRYYHVIIFVVILLVTMALTSDEKHIMYAIWIPLSYLFLVFVTRIFPSNRSKKCDNCGRRDEFTFWYSYEEERYSAEELE